MIIYAQLNENDICVGLSQLSRESDDQRLIKIDSMDMDLIWRKYENGQWSAEKYEPQTTAPLTEFEQLKVRNTQLEQQLAQTNADLASLMEFITTA